MKKMILLCIMLAASSGAVAQDKSGYDIDLSAQSSVAVSKIVPVQTTYELLQAQKSEFTLISDGYFTIGTTADLASGKLDDNCQVTFGHPYAMTSYPFFSLDGTEQLPASYFYNLIQNVQKEGNTLSLHASDQSTVRMDFEMTSLNNGATIRLTCTVWNFGDTTHDIGLGLMVDPALGKWGDGFPFLDGDPVTETTVVSDAMPGNLEIWERKSIPRGLGMDLFFVDNLPDELHIGNWFDLSSADASGPLTLYDTAVKMKWDEVALEPGESVSAIVDLNLETPEFDDGVFIRTDLPSFLSVQDNKLFPRPIMSTVEVINNSMDRVSNLRLEFEGDNTNYNWKSSDTFSLLPQAKNVGLIPADISDTVDDQVVTLGVRVTRSDQTQDYLERNVFIPGIPRSNTGLSVFIDSVGVFNFPDVDITFRALIEESGQVVSDLRAENVFLLEDGSPVRNFELRKDIEDGTNLADIVFVLDVTGSMGAEIDMVKENIIEFTDSLRVNGVDFRLAMVTFSDYIENIYDFIDDPAQFKEYVNEQNAFGGGDRPENSLDALVAAAEMPFRESAARTVIWITDANYHNGVLPTQYTIQEAVDILLANSAKVHCIGDPQYKQTYYDPFTLATGGDFFDIAGNFRDILLDISRTDQTGKYVLSYTSDGAAGEAHNLELTAYYASYGGSATGAYDLSGGAGKEAVAPTMACYPNPFNPVIRISLANPELHGGEVDIYNILGQKVWSQTFHQGAPQINMAWDATNDHGEYVSNGMYFVRARLIDPHGNNELLPVAKIICAK